MREQRKQPRFEDDVVVTFENATDRESVGRGLDEMPCILTEISEGGARIRVTRRLPPGTPLLLHLVLESEEDDDVYLRLHAETRWSPAPDSDPPHHIGLEFSPLDEADRAALRLYIRKKLAEVA
jgi:hypothetical protein